MAVKEKDPKENLKNPDFWHTINPGYVVAGIATLTASILSIKGSFYKNFHESKIGKALEKVRNADLKAALDNAKNDFPTYVKAVKEAETKFEQGVENTMKAAGFSENILKKTVQQFRTLKPHQQIGVGLTFATVLSVGVGALLGNLHTRKVQHQLNLDEVRDSNRQMAR